MTKGGFLNTEDKMVQIVFSESSNMYFDNILKSFLKENVF